MGVRNGGAKSGGGKIGMPYAEICRAGSPGNKSFRYVIPFGNMLRRMANGIINERPAVVRKKVRGESGAFRKITNEEVRAFRAEYDALAGCNKGQKKALIQRWMEKSGMSYSSLKNIGQRLQRVFA